MSRLQLELNRRAREQSMLGQADADACAAQEADRYQTPSVKVARHGGQPMARLMMMLPLRLPIRND